jgi:hypothetical protein
VTASRDLLAAQYKGSEHKLGDWGYTVDASSQPTAGAESRAQSRQSGGESSEEPKSIISR